DALDTLDALSTSPTPPWALPDPRARPGTRPVASSAAAADAAATRADGLDPRQRKGSPDRGDPPKRASQVSDGEDPGGLLRERRRSLLATPSPRGRAVSSATPIP
ncbi:unnamed protein product, partial [Prorocentrum cordatum]